MKISASKKQLANIVSENGGWPRSAEYSAQDGSDGQVSFYRSGVPIYNKLAKIWNAPGSCVHMYGSRIEGLGRVGVIKNFHQTILSRDEYFYLYPAPDADGWIEWNGGECPVDGDSVIDVKLSDGDEFFGVDADWDWHQGSGCDIVAYRLHKPEILPDAKEPKPAQESMPTIEQLAADYRNAKDYADRKQQEADDAKTDADAKLVELVAAGKALGLVLGVADAAPVTTKFTGKFHSAKYGDRPSDLDMICDGCGKRFGHHVGFDCRP